MIKQNLIVILALVLSFQALGNDKDYSYDADKVEIAFKDWFRLESDEIECHYKKGVISIDELCETDRDTLDKSLKLQALHLYGVFTYHESPTQFAVYSGAILEANKPEVLKLNKTSKGLVVSYLYKDFGNFHIDLLEGWEEWDFEFYMPNSPNKIYQAGLVDTLDPKTGLSIKKNFCTDPHDSSELAFWYYWSPDRPKCPRKFRRAIHKVKANFKRLEKTELKYPEYEKLFQKNIIINVIVGQDEKFGDPKDLGLKTFHHEVNFLKNIQEKESGEILFETVEESEYKVELRYPTQYFEAKINFYYANTDAPDFDLLARKVLKESDIFVFSGHSYEGYYFDLERLFMEFDGSLPINKYQILFFNSCTSSSYYRDNYFKVKITDEDPLGSENLDIITNAIGAPFVLEGNVPANTVNTDIIFLTSLLGLDTNGTYFDKLQSWQDILKLIAVNAGFDYTALTNIDGEEDNPEELPREIGVPRLELKR